MKDIFRDRPSHKNPVLMSWHSLGNALAIEISCRAGWHATLIDLQHGLRQQSDLSACIAAAQLAGCPSLVRVPSNESSYIEHALDSGAQGIVCPMVNTAGDAYQLVQNVKYPPIGTRSYGPFRAKLSYQGDYFKEANSWAIACAQIETKQAITNLDDILSLESLDMILVGPNDLAISLSEGKSKDIYDQTLLKTLSTIPERCHNAKKMCGIFANNADYAKVLISMGWDVIGVMTDTAILDKGYRSNLALLSK